MKKIKITKEQYERLVLTEQKRVLNTENYFLTESINGNAELLEEGWKDIVLGLSLLMGLQLTGQNNAIAQKAVQNKDIMNQIEATLEDEDKTQELIDKMKEKGMADPSAMLSKNAETIINNFNDLSDKEKMGAKLSVVTVKNLKSLESKLKQGYALKSTDIKKDTIKGVVEKNIVQVKDTVKFEFGNMNNFFVTGQYKLSEDGKSAILDAIDSIKSQNGKVLSANIISSTDAEDMPSLKSKDDPSGNITLANYRAESVSNLVSGLIDGGNVTISTIPNNGSLEFSADMFKKAKIAGTSAVIRGKSAKYRYVIVEFVVEFTDETEEPNPQPDKYIEKYRFEVVKMYEGSSGTIKIGGKKPSFKHKKYTCKRKKLKDKSIVSKCATF